MTALRAGGATDVGKVRTNNQDAFLVTDRICVVCDGVGGHQGGEVAAATAVESIRDGFSDGTLEGLLQAIETANERVWSTAQADPSLRGMGTTVTAVALVEEEGEERLAIVNVGDSRGYLLQQGELTQLTEDHSLVEQMYREGRISRAEADVHPQRSLITRALGLDEEVEVDTWQVLPDGVERILLCSDGLTNEVPDDRIASVLRRLADPDEAARELIRAANDAGGRDNVTVVVVDVVDSHEAAITASRVVAATAESGAPEAQEGDDERPPAEPVPAARTAQARRRGVRDALTWRVSVFTLAVVAVVGIAGAAVGWYARRAYFVGVDGDEVTVFRGRPGGLLWFDPTVEHRTGLDIGDVPESRRDDVRDGHETSDRAAAERYVANLRDEADATRTPVTTRTFATTPSTALLTPPTSALPPP